MNVKAAKNIEAFRDSVYALFDDIQSWISPSSLKAIKEETELVEENSGKYKIDKLTLKDKKGNTIAEFIPYGAYVIGANGRIDLNGTIGRAIIVNLEKGGPSYSQKIIEGKKIVSSKSTSFYKGVDKDGWYWIENRILGKAFYLDKELFIDLIREVSDYEFN